MAAVGRHHRRGAAALWPRHLFCGFLCSSYRLDAVELVVDLVDGDLDVGLVDVDLVDVYLVGAALADIGRVDDDFEVDLDLDRITRQECFRPLTFEKCCTTN